MSTAPARDEFIRDVVISTTDGIVSVDEGGTVVFANQPIERLLGYDPEELVGEPIERLFPEAHRSPLESVRRASNGGTGTGDHGFTDASMVRADGREVPVTFTAETVEHDRKRFYTLTLRELAGDPEPREGSDLGRKVFEENNDAVLVFDPNADEFTEVNPRACELLGYSREELLSLGPSDVHPHQMEVFTEFVEGVVGDGSGLTDELSCRTADGNLVPVEVSASVVHLDGRQQVLANVRNISERVKQERELFRTIFEHSNDMILLMNPEEDEFVEANPKACELLGYSREELLSLGPSEIHPHEVETFTDFVEGVLESGSSWTDELSCYTADDELLPAEVSASAIEIDDQPHIIALVRDITERKAREQEREQYRRMVEAVGEGMYVADEDMRFTVVNEGMAELTGYDREELVGRHLADVLAGEAEDVDPEEYEPLMTEGPTSVVDRESARAARERLRAGDEEVVQLEAPIHTEDGGLVPVDVRTSELPTGAETGFRGTTGVLIDVSERKEHERRLEALTRASRELTGATDREEISRTALDAVEEILGFESSCIREFDPDTNSLDPVAMSDGAAELIESRPAFDLEASLAGQAYRREEPIVTGTDDRGLRTEEASLHLPLGDHGSLTIIAPGTDSIDDAQVNAAEVLAGTITAHLDRAERESTVRENNETVRRQRDQLDTLNRVNSLVQELIQELIEAGTRDDIEEQVCERLAESDLYRSAWVAETDVTGDGITGKTGAGVEDSYLEAVGRMSLDRVANGTVEEAIETGTVTTTRQYQISGGEPGSEPDAGAGGTSVDRMEATAAIPLGHRDRIYGVLVVTANDEDAFDKTIRSGLEVLGDTIGFTINAVQNEELLLSDELVELEFDVTDETCLAVYVSDRLDCYCRLEQAFLTDERNHVAYLRIDDAAPEAAREVVMSMETAVDCRVVNEGGEGVLLEVVRTASGSEVMMDVGATIQTATAESGEGTLIVEAPRTADVRGVVERYQAYNPESELVAKREVNRPLRAADEFRDSVTDGLTEKQKRAIKTAYYSGYYDWPRESTAEEVADTVGVASATLHQHLRRAEWKLLSAFFGEDDGAGA